jgi:CubicO group peptidase (beta-lactamase class C family)
MDRGVREGIFPGGVLLVSRCGESSVLITAGRIGYAPDDPSVCADTIYDLASLTKILSTTILVMIFLDQKRLRLEDTLDRFWPGRVPDGKGAITCPLLSHSSGLPAWRPFYER